MLNRIHIAYLEGYSEPCQISKELFTETVNGLNIYRYRVQVQEIFLVFLCFALKISIELLSLISRGSIFHNKLF